MMSLPQPEGSDVDNVPTNPAANRQLFTERRNCLALASVFAVAAIIMAILTIVTIFDNEARLGAWLGSFVPAAILLLIAGTCVKMAPPRNNG